VIVLAIWLLIAPGSGWSWIIIDFAESKAHCETKRSERLDRGNLLCVKSDRS